MASLFKPLTVSVPANSEREFPVSGRFFAFKEATSNDFKIALDDGPMCPWSAGLSHQIAAEDAPFKVIRIENNSDATNEFIILVSNGRTFDARLGVTVITQLETIAKDGTDADAVAAPTGGEGVRGWLSGIYDRLKTSGPIGALITALSAKLPAALGLSAAANSLSVTLASDHAPVPVLDSLAVDVSADLEAVNDAATIATAGRAAVVAQISGTYNAASVAFEASYDGGTIWLPVLVARVGSSIAETASGELTDTSRAWVAAIPTATHFRVRCTAYDTGTIAALVRAGTLSTPTAQISEPAAAVTGTATSVATDATGTAYEPFPSAACVTLELFNASATPIEYQRDGAGVAIPISAGASRQIRGIANADQIAVRRVDLDTTPVTVYAELYTA